MNALVKVFGAKIALTLVLWTVPLLWFPADLLRTLGFPAIEPLLFLRLLGMAYLALVVGYVFGRQAAIQGIYPAAAVWVGIVSNGGAFAIMAVAALDGTWDFWGIPARVYMWASLLGTLLITIGLVISGPLRRPKSK